MCDQSFSEKCTRDSRSTYTSVIYGMEQKQENAENGKHKARQDPNYVSWQTYRHRESGQKKSCISEAAGPSEYRGCSHADGGPVLSGCRPL